MRIGLIGLGRMGANMARRLVRGGHEVVGYDRDPKAADALKSEDITPAHSLDELIAALDAPRAVWVMVPAGAPTEATVREFAEKMTTGDIIIDGGNSHYKDDARRAKELAGRGIMYVDAGTSGGLWGLERGYCLMVGGAKEAFDRLEPIFKTLAPGQGEIKPSKGRGAGPDGKRSTAEQGYLHCGPAGSGHFVKMVHNGIEYGMMQAMAEGFDIMRNAGAAGEGPARETAGEKRPEELRYELNLADIAELWRRGSVVTSWLLDLAAISLAEKPTLEGYEGYVADSGEGRWTVEAAVEQATPAEVLTAALYARFRSRQQHTFADQMLSALRFQFGGHTEKMAKGEK